MPAESTSFRFGIVGAGMLGLTLAYRLSKAGHHVTVIEAADALGGQSSTWQLGDITWDRHYHIIAHDDQQLLKLLAELGLSDQVVWRPTYTGFFARGKLYSLSNIAEFLKFPVITLIEKFRLGLTILRASSLKDMKPYENQTSLSWLTRWSGKTTTEKLWTPLLQSKFGQRFGELSASFIISTIKRSFGARKAKNKQEMYGYVKGGYETILTVLRKELEQSGVVIRLSTPVQQVAHQHVQAHIALQNETLTFDRAIITTAAPLLPLLCPQLSEAEKHRYANVDYLGIVCASLLLEKPISKYYITNILDRWVPFTGVIEMSALVDTAEFGGNSLVYLPRYLPSGSPELRGDDTALEQHYMDVLEKMYPHFHRSQVRSFRVSRVRYIMPVPTPHLQQNPLPVCTGIPGIFAINTGHVAEGVLTVNKIILVADAALPQCLAPA